MIYSDQNKKTTTNKTKTQQPHDQINIHQWLPLFQNWEGGGIVVAWILVIRQFKVDTLGWKPTRVRILVH